MSQGITADERETAVRVVACPTCWALPGKRCRTVRGDVGMPTTTHKVRVDAYFNTYREHALAEELKTNVQP